MKQDKKSFLPLSVFISGRKDSWILIFNTDGLPNRSVVTYVHQEQCYLNKQKWHQGQILVKNKFFFFTKLNS